MAKGKAFAPLVAVPAAAKPASHGGTGVALLEPPDPTRLRTELSLSALALGGFEARDRTAQFPAGPDALLRLQQLAGNDFVTKALARTDLTPAPPIAAPPEPTGAPARDQPGTRETEKPTGKPAEPPKPHPAEAKGQQEKDTAAPRDAGAAKLDAPPEPARGAEITRDGGLKVKQGSSAASAAPGGGGGSAAPEVQAWSNKARGTAAKRLATPKAPKMEGAGEATQAKAGAVVQQRKAGAKDRKKDAEKAIPPPPKAEGKDLVPLDPLEKTIQDVFAQVSTKKLSSQYLSALVVTPGYNKNGKLIPSVMPLAGADKPAPDAEAKPDSSKLAAKKGEKGEARKKADDANKELTKPPEAQSVVGPPKPVEFHDRGPQPGKPASPEKKAVMAAALGSVQEKAAETAEKLVTSSESVAYPNNALHEADESIAEKAKPAEKEGFAKELEGVRDAAGLTQKDIEAAKTQAKGETKEKAKDADDAVGKAADAAKKDAKDAAAADKANIDAAGAAVKDQIDAKRKAAGAPPDAAYVRDKEKRLVEKAIGDAAAMRAAYKSTGEKRAADLQRAGLAQVAAYDRAANAEAEKIKALYTGEDEQARVESRPSLDWGDKRIVGVQNDVLRLQKEARAEAEKFRRELDAPEKAAIDAVHDWATKELGHEKGLWERIVELVQEWLTRARKDTAAQQAQSNADNAEAMSGDLDLIEKIEQARREGNREELAKLIDGLDDEQQVVIGVYFNDPGGDAIGAVTAGLLLRIQKHRAKELVDRFREASFNIAGWEKLNILGNSQDKGFDAGTEARNVRYAVKGWGTDEAKLFAAIARKTPIQVKAMEVCYAATYGRNMREDIEDDLSGDEWKRAKAALASDTAGEDIATIHDALFSFSTDSATVLETLRSKTPEEREAIKKRYEEEYGTSLDMSLTFRLGRYDKARAKLLMKGDVEGADAVGVRAALKDGFWGADASAIDSIYSQVRKEVEAEAASKKMTTAEVEAEVKRRGEKIKASYNQRYAKGASDGLEKDYKANLEGGEQRLALGLAQNDRAAIDEGRIESSRGFWRTRDETVLNVLRDQKKRAEIEVKRDMTVHIREDIAKAKPPLTAEQIKRKFEDAAKEADAKIDTETKKNTQGLLDKYDEHHPSDKPGALLKMTQRELSHGVGGLFGNEGDVAKAIIEGKGKISDEEELYWATYGAGTDEDTIKRILKGKSPKEVQKLREKYEALKAKKGEKGSLDDDIKGDVSGRFGLECTELLEGEPQTTKEKIAQLKRRKAFEDEPSALSMAMFGPVGASGAKKFTKWMASDESDVLDNTINELEKEDKEFQKKLKALNLSENDPDLDLKLPVDVKKQKERIDRWAGYGDQDVELYRKSLDSVADTVATVGAVAVAVAVGVAISIASGGTATPAVIAGWSAAAGALTGVGIKVAMKGNAYGWEEMGQDLVIGAVDVAFAVLTAGVGNWFLRSGILSRMAKGPVLSRMLAHGFSQGMEGLAGALPSGLAGTLMNEETWHGDPLKNILLGLATAGGTAVAGGGLLGSFHGIKAPAPHGAPHISGGHPEVHVPETKVELPHDAGVQPKLGDAGAAPHQKPGVHEELHPTSKAESDAHVKAREELETGEGAMKPDADSSPHEIKGAGEKPAARDAGVVNAAEADAPSPGRRAAPELEAGLSKDLRKKVAIEIDPSLEPTTVQVHYEQVDGVVTRVWIVAGAEAQVGHIAEHEATVRAMRRYAGLTGRLRKVMRSLASWVNVNGEPQPGTKAWEAILETNKLEGIIDARLKLLQSGALSPEEFEKTVQEIASLTDQLRTHEQTAAMMDMDPGAGFVAQKGNKKDGRFTPPGYEPPPEGHHYRRTEDGKYILVANRNIASNAERFRLNLETGKVEVRPKVRETFGDFKNKMARAHPDRLKGVPEVEEMMDRLKMPKEDRGVVRRWEPTLTKLKASLTPEEFNTLIKDLEGQMKGKADKALGQSQYDKFRHALRKKTVDHILNLPVDKQHDAIAAFFKALPPEDRGSMGGLFRSYREGRIREANLVNEPNDTLKNMRVLPDPPDGTRVRVSLEGGGDADGAIAVLQGMEVEGGPPAGKQMVDDKGGTKPFDREQAKKYSKLLDKGDGKLSAGEATYDGLVYFFYNEADARRAALFMVANELHPNLRAGYFDKHTGQFHWVKRPTLQGSTGALK